MRIGPVWGMSADWCLGCPDQIPAHVIQNHGAQDRIPHRIQRSQSRSIIPSCCRKNNRHGRNLRFAARLRPGTKILAHARLPDLRVVLDAHCTYADDSAQKPRDTHLY